MRSSAIAEELIARGVEVIFVGVFDDIPWLSTRMYELGFSQILTHVEEFNSNPATDILILDSYILPVQEEFIQQRRWKGVVTIVDELTPEYKADLKIYPGLSTKWVQATTTKTLSGPKYIPIRKSIRKNLGNVDESGSVEILIIGGGTDTLNFVGAVSEALTKIQNDFHAHVFAGRNTIHQLDSRFEYLPMGSELDSNASTVDLVFTTASTTSLEFIAREVAVGIGCAVDNQEDYYKTLSLAGVAIPIGRYVEGVWQLNQSRITELVISRDVRRNLRQKCAGLIDLEGSVRIVDEILKV
jgi:spore coat polysaccharide biosynthesis predicted glycosyltransferase SpsG